MSFRTATQIAVRRTALPTFRPRHPFRQNNLSALRRFHTTPPNMVVHNIATKAEFDEAVKAHSVVIVDAFAIWCGPCKAIAPIIAKMSDEDRFKDVYFIKIDVDHLPELSQELGITAMPTFIGYKNGEISDKVIGASPQKITDLVTKTQNL